MSSSDATDYYRARAEEERRAAETASNARAAQAHREMASHYERLAGQHAEPLVARLGETEAATAI